MENAIKLTADAAEQLARHLNSIVHNNNPLPLGYVVIEAVENTEGDQFKLKATYDVLHVHGAADNG